MIQAVVTPEHRGDMGMHYTSVPNIMKVMQPLFLDELYEKFEKSKSSNKKLQELINRISNLKIFDPACGSGNFLIIAYKELRRLEIKILKAIDDLEIKTLKASNDLSGKRSLAYSDIKLTKFYGIELDDFAHEVAILSLWLAEHQMNLEFYKAFARTSPSLPLQDGGNIVHGNATTLDWAMVCPKGNGDEIYILGNPPYLGRRNQNKEQKEEIEIVLGELKSFRGLDYICIWFYKGSEYIRNINSKCAFVSTNSIVQGELVSLFWPTIFSKMIDIKFAYQSFKWQNNAKSNAGVTVVVIGLGNISNTQKYLYCNNTKITVKNINAYLTNATNIFIHSSSKPISKLPAMSYGNMPGGCTDLFLLPPEKDKLLNQYPELSSYIKKLIGSQESINNIEKYCLWFKNISLDNEILQIPEIANKLEIIKHTRESSKDSSYNKLSDRPHQFRDLKETITHSILIPIVSSENRKYIPVSLVNQDCIVPNSAQVIYNTDIWVFGVVTSHIHMAWMRAVGGRLKTDYRYSKNVIYNTFPFPNISEKQKEEITELVFNILDEREKHSEKTLAQQYDPDKMPLELKEAHHKLDLAIEKCYRNKPFENDEERLEYLFKLYEEMIKKEKNIKDV